MKRKLSELMWNEIVLLDRVELNVLISHSRVRDERNKLAEKVLNRAIKLEQKTNTPCMNVPVKVWELKILFPDCEIKPQIWQEMRR